MRVTQSMLSNNMIRNISNNYEKLAKLQEQITSQKKFSKPSDDPVGSDDGDDLSDKFKSSGAIFKQY